MFDIIRNIRQVRFDKGSKCILWGESLIFSAIYGAMFHSWPVFGIFFIGLAVLMSSPKTVVYTIFILSFLWCFIFAAIGYGISGWVGAMVLGSIVFFNGVKLHLRDLKSSTDLLGHINAAAWRQNWYGQQNLN